MNQIIDIFSILSLVIFIFIGLKNLQSAILIGILIKPLIDTSWDIKIAGLSLIEIFSVIFIFYAYYFAIKNKLFKGIKSYYVVLWFLAHIGIVFSFLYSPIDGLTSLMKCLYFPIALVLLPYFVSQKDSSHKVLQYLIIGALFSSLISVFQLLGIIPYEYEHASKGLQRANGFYHDMVTSRIYVIQGMLTIAFCLHNKIFIFDKKVLYGVVVILLIASYALFSKAMIITLILGFVLLIFTGKIRLISVLLLLPLLLYLGIANPEIIQSTEQLFSTEIELNEGGGDEERFLSGRGGLWNNYLSEFDKSSGVEKLFGLGINSGRTHNEFVRILILSGYIGIAAYILLFLNFIFDFVKNLTTKNNNNFVILFSISILIVDSIGVVWGLYPFYLILIIGFLQLGKLDNKYNLT